MFHSPKTILGPYTYNFMFVAWQQKEKDGGNEED